MSEQQQSVEEQHLAEVRRIRAAVETMRLLLLSGAVLVVLGLLTWVFVAMAS